MDASAADVVSHMDSVDADVALMMEQSETNKKRGRPKKEEGAGSEAKAKAARKSSSGRTKAPKCKGCRHVIPVEDCAPNFPGCIPCKRVLDNISKLAHRQGKEAVAFVKEQRECDDKCFNMVQSYLEVCPEACDAGGAKNKKRGKWSVAKFQERTTAASGFIRDKIGEMMPKKLYVEFAQTTRGGRKSDDAAIAQWAEWEGMVAAKNPDVYFDYLGENGALRVWVHTGDETRFRSSYMHSKEAVAEAEAVKKPNEQALQSMKARVTTKHDVMQDQNAICQALARNGEQAFQGNDGFLVDVTELGSKEAKGATPITSGASVNESASSTAIGAGNEESEASSEKKSQQPKVWVDRDRVVSSTIRTASSQIASFKEKAVAKLTELKENLANYQNTSEPDFNKNFAGELKVLEVRVEALELVLDLALV